jgi:hypothetical protein
MLLNDRYFDQDKIYIIPMGDIHFGDKGFSKESKRKLNGYLDWVAEHDNAYIFLNGDIMNTATRFSKSSPFEQDLDGDEQLSEALFYFEPVKDKILGAVLGNHERRLKDVSGTNLTRMLCIALRIEYFKYTAVLKLKVKDNEYIGVFAHTTGGGSSVGGKMNRVDKMRHSTIPTADFYCGSHNHMLGVVPVETRLVDRNRIIRKKQMLVDCGGYLDWDNSYAEASQLEPYKLGSPRIRLEGVGERDIHVSV